MWFQPFDQSDLDALLNEGDRKCIYNSNDPNCWKHLQNTKGIAKYRCVNKWEFRPINDRFGKNNVYVVYENELEFLSDK